VPVIAKFCFLVTICVDEFSLIVRYYIDPETTQPHIYNHGVEENEVEEVLKSQEKIVPVVKVLVYVLVKQETENICVLFMFLIQYLRAFL